MSLRKERYDLPVGECSVCRPTGDIRLALQWRRSEGPSAFGGKDTVEVEGRVTSDGGAKNLRRKFSGKNFYEKGMKNFSGREIFDRETIGGTDPRIRLRHTDGVGRGNVRWAWNEREMILESERKRGGIRKVSPAARDGGARKEWLMEGKHG